MKQYDVLAFDFDGTLFDTYEANFKAYQLAYYDLGVEITKEQFSKVKGLNAERYSEVMGVIEVDVKELRRLKTKYYRNLSLYSKPNKYLIELLKTHRSAIVTTAQLVNIQPLLKKYDLHPEFIITGDDVSEYKPDPECYDILVAKADTDNIIAFEDSRPGFVSARAAGLDCFRVGKFETDCILNMSGGSNAKTVAKFVDNSLVVEKTAFGADESKLLKAQYDWLVENASDNIVKVVSESYNGDDYSYIMEYVASNNLYNYINKAGAIPKVAMELDNLSKSGEIKQNDKDIRMDIFERHILNGAVEANREVPIKLEEIPEFVNNFRITRYHGDTTFENTMILRDGSIFFIDPVPYRNAITGVAHDFSKVGQSLCGYEPIRDGVNYDYEIECAIYDEMMQKYLTEDEYKSMKFYVGALFMRRMKYQVKQDMSLVEPYYNIAKRLFDEFKAGSYSWS